MCVYVPTPLFKTNPPGRFGYSVSSCGSDISSLPTLAVHWTRLELLLNKRKKSWTQLFVDSSILPRVLSTRVLLPSAVIVRYIFINIYLNLHISARSDVDELRSVCSMQCSVCSMQCSVCHMQCSVCSMQCSVCHMQCEV